MKKLPIGLQNFQEIIEQDYLYVDKTRQIYELMGMGKLYFLSRPRRFGKSLLISILKQIFKGNQDLFKNLYIGTQTDYSWEKYPVLQFNFADFGFQQLHIEEALEEDLENYAKAYHIKLPK